MLNQIVDIIDEIKEEYPIIGNELDGKIYYMNGNDGTDFDWKCNGRTCEFMVFNDNEMGYIKLMVYNDNVIDIYVYQDGGMKPTQELTRYYDENPIELANFLYRVFDENGLWDESIDEHVGATCDGSIAYELLDDEDEEEDW